MSKKYTVTAGIGDKEIEYQGTTNSLFVALIWLHKIKVDKDKIYWKTLTVR